VPTSPPNWTPSGPSSRERSWPRPCRGSPVRP
jgi:hypothetical protein